jgi:hypothetical protein
VVGNSYLLRRATCAVKEDANPQHILTIPYGAVVTVLKRCSNNSHDLLTVEWNHANCSMFAVDLEERGELVTDSAMTTGA